MTLRMTPGWRAVARCAVAVSVSLSVISGASAEDGLRGFFAAMFGGGAPQPAVQAPASMRRHPRFRAHPVVFGYPADFARPVAFARRIERRPLTIRLHPARPHITVADAPTIAGPVSIFEDRTLRRGDAVMTGKGVRVFAGSSSWPYTAADFVGLDDARHLSRDTSRVLAQLDKVPRS